jgi:hypothetical protein
MSDVSQGPDWWQAADSKWYPPEQHPDNASRPPSPRQNVPTPQRGQYAGAGGSGITFDRREIGPGGLIVLAGGLLYCVFGFFPWYVQNIDCGLVGPGIPCAVSLNAWRSGTALFSAILFLLAAGAFLAKALKVIPAPKVPLELVALGAVVLGDLFFLIAFFSVPAGFFGISRGWGLWIDLVVAIAITAGAVLQFLGSRRANPAV